MRTDDRFGAAERNEGRCSQAVGSCGSLLLPDPLEDELEIRRLDPTRARLVRGQATSGRAEIDLAGRRLVEHCLDELRLDLDRSARELVEALHGPNDGLAGGPAIEMVEP